MSRTKSVPVALLLAILCIVLSSAVKAQTPWIQIQEEYQAGSIDINEFINRQLDLIDPITGQQADFIHKCAAPLFITAEQHREELTPETRARLSSSGSKARMLPETYITGSGKFQIFYEITGNDAVPLTDANSNSVPDYVEWVGEAADLSYDHEINTIGFTDPIPAGQLYSIYIIDMGFYGTTRLDGTEPAGTYIEIENDFDGFPPNSDPEGDQKGAVKVTMAHELKHAIQFAQNNWTGDSDFWAEMDATLYEEVVYDEVNDYYNYLDGFADNYFVQPAATLIPGSYEDVAWALYFEENFGDQFWKEVWDRIEANNSVGWFNAIDQTLADYGTTFREAVTEAALWHYASGIENSVAGYGFDESFDYPSPRLSESYDSLQTILTESKILRRFAVNYYEYDLSLNSNELVQFNYLTDLEDLNFAVIAYYQTGDVETFIYTDTEIDVEVENQMFVSWEQLDKLGFIVFNSSSSSSANYQFRVFDYFPDIAGEIELAQNYPNPFNPQTTINVTAAFSQEVRLDVFDYTGRHIRTLQNGLLSAGVTPIRFDARGLASGVYYYRLESRSGVQIKKMTLIK